MREVAITAMSVLSPIGNSVRDFKTALFQGASGVRRISGPLISPDFPVPYAASVVPFEAPACLAKWEPRPSEFTKAAVFLLNELAQSIPPGLPIDAIAAGYREFNTFSVGHRILEDGHFESADLPLLSQRTAIRAIGHYLREEKNIEVRPDRQVLMIDACASGNSLLHLALRHIRSGNWERAIVSCFEFDPHPLQIMNLFLLGALSTRNVAPELASCPFSAERAGFVKAEGGAMFLLESVESARLRGATILGVLAGGGDGSDGWRLTDGRPDASSLIRTMDTAIQDAGLDKTEVDSISAHGTSTGLGDRLEVKAIKAVFGPRAYKIPVSSLKSQIGHATIAAGAIEAVACLLMLQEQRLAPTINLTAGDQECDLDFVPNESRAAAVEIILSNSIGFGGQNSSLIFKRVPSS